MATTTRAVFGLSALAVVFATGAWYCGGQVDETSTTTTTFGTPGPARPADPDEVAGTTTPDTSARVKTPLPTPQVPQPPCTSCPAITPREQPER